MHCIAENLEQEITKYNFTMKHSQIVYLFGLQHFITVKRLYPAARTTEYHIEHNPVSNQQQLGKYCDSYLMYDG